MPFGGKNVIEYVIKGLDQSGPVLKSFKGRLDSILKSKVALAGAAVAAGAAILRFGKEAVRAYNAAIAAAGKYQKKILEIVTLTNQNDKATKQMSRDLQALAVEFGQVAEVMAQAQYNVVSAGFNDIADSMFILEVASKAAIGGVSDVNTAAKVITQTLNAFNMEAKDAEKVAGVLFATVKGGVTTFTELSGNLGKVSSTAAAAGISFDEVAAALAVMTKNGISTSEAANALNALIVAIGAAAGESGVLLLDMGITLEDGLAPALAAVDAAGGESLSTLKELVPNIRALKAAASAGADGAKGLKEQLEAATTGVKDFNTAYAIMSAGFDQAVARQTAAQGRLKNAIGATGVEGQTKVIDGVTEATNDWAVAVENNTKNITEMNTAAGELVGNIAGSGGAAKTAAVEFADWFAAFPAGIIVPLNDALKQTAENISDIGAEFALLEDLADVSALGPFNAEAWAEQAEEAATAAARAALEALAAEFGVSATETILDPSTLQFIDIPKTTEKLTEDLTAAFNAIELPEGMVSPPKIFEAAEMDELEKSTAAYEEDLRNISDLLMEIGLDPWPNAETQAAMDEYVESQRELEGAVNDVGRNFERLASDSFSAMIKGSNGAIMFGRTLKTIVIDALSAVIVKLLIIKGLTSIFSSILGIGGVKDGGTIPQFAGGGAIPRAANGFAVPDGPRGMDSVLIAAMPGEHVITKTLSNKLGQFLASQENAAAVSPFALQGGGGGRGEIHLHMDVARPVGVLDAMELGQDLVAVADKVQEADLT